MFQAAIFDIGQTLVEYKVPLNWSKLYKPAFENIADRYGYDLTEEHYQHVIHILTKYNTRIHPRNYEVSSSQIFTEILNGMEIPMEDMEQVKTCFYSFFRQNAAPFEEAEQTLKLLSAKGIKLGTLSDVAYGMDNIYALADISSLKKYIDFPFTSNDSGYRKPHAEGLKMLSQKMHLPLSDIIFVGDEEKDIICGKNAGAYSVLINRDETTKNYGQDMEIHSLLELLDIFNLS